MKYIREKESYLGTGYDIFIDDTLIKKIFITRVSKDYNGFQYIFLLDSEGKVIEEVFEYLNNHIRTVSLNAREQAATALKMFYSFLEIKEIGVKEITKIDIKNLSDFLQGINVEGMVESYESSHSRSISTHNLYFDAIRSFFKTMNYENDYLFETITVNVENSGFGMLGHKKTVKVDKFKTNKTRHSSYTQYVPKYISLEEYREILDYIDKSNSKNKLRNKLIVNLLYTRGLRLGEVLGITLEDIKSHPENPNAGILLLRNRVSDKKYQFAKGCLKVSSKRTYQSKTYNEKDAGFQQITIPTKLMGDIKKYIDVSRDPLSLSDKVWNNIANLSKADSVERQGEENYYLFLNKNGASLSSSGWNKTIKEIFKGVGIKIDRGSKTENLSHRFRHGYAMYLIEVENREITYVQKELRHKSLQSTQRYYNPKPETILKDTERVQENMMSKYKG